jgi:hypothetical protein
VAFKLTNEQVAKRAALAIDVRQKAQALNRAVVAFNEMATPLSRAIAQAQDSYNATLETARVLAGDISEAAQLEYDAKSERWQDGDVGIQVRVWIESWEMNLDDIDLDPPAPLEEIDADEHADKFEGTARNPADFEQMRRRMIYQSS